MTEAALTEDLADVVVDGAAEPVDAAPAPDVTEKAAKLGWTPKDQFKGDPEKWVDADAFVKRGEELMPLLKAHNRKLERKVAELEGTLTRFSDYADKAEKRAYERAVRDLKAEMADAVAAGDQDAASDVAKRMVDLNTEMAVPKPETKPAKDEAFEDWRAENDWYDKDPILQAAAFAIAEQIKGDFPDPARQLAEVTKRIKAKFPAEFAPAANPKRSAAPAVEGAPAPGQRTNGKSYSDLPADAKAACDDFVKRVPGFTRDKYVKDFFAQ